jgi:hypothetical protein
MITVVFALLAAAGFVGARLMPAKRDSWLGLAYLSILIFVVLLFAGGEGPAPGECTRGYGGFDC